MIHTDMGGTSFDASIVEDGYRLSTHEYELEWEVPVITPMLDIRNVGAGGSITWINAGSSLRVGPQSAGADAGPACYNRGEKAEGGTHLNDITLLEDVFDEYISLETACDVSGVVIDP